MTGLPRNAICFDPNKKGFGQLMFEAAVDTINHQIYQFKSINGRLPTKVELARDLNIQRTHLYRLIESLGVEIE